MQEARETLPPFLQPGGLGYCIEKYVNGPIPVVIWEDGILKSFFFYAAAAIGIAAFALAEYKGTRTAE